MSSKKKNLPNKIKSPPKSNNHRMNQVSRTKTPEKSRSKSRVKDFLKSKEKSKRPNYILSNHKAAKYASPEKKKGKSVSSKKSHRKGKAEKNRTNKKVHNIYTQ